MLYAVRFVTSPLTQRQFYTVSLASGAAHEPSMFAFVLHRAYTSIDEGSSQIIGRARNKPQKRFYG